ncbi:U32 family peptidase [Alginatibacterium sediminis]|uniref:Ubiquinone biosynthesis protein UbiU n=1 Tax=Alginatibacterium sediminis TaxID=2164068 RepID=A0A420E9T9_9ALTE|nr:peptidase U32 family protein [Alginatibacterium sediminis]RKF17443.1 U32 family peptidase [Alginatibacterium sediminis]
MELLCPAGSLPALKTALKSGADSVYIGLKDDTNARHFAGLNFNDKRLIQAAELVRKQGKKLNLAINTFAHPGDAKQWYKAVDCAAANGIDAVIVADIAVLDYCAQHHPDLEVHLSVQASATNAQAVAYYQNNFGVSRVVLPRVLSIHQVKQIARSCPTMEFEVFAYGSLCIMAEGRCYLSSYLTGESPNTVGACSPASFVRWEEGPEGLESRLNKILIDRYAPNETTGYPTLCKGRFDVDGQVYHALEEPTSLNTLELIPELAEANIAAVKIEGRQRSPAYVQQVTQVWRQALDRYSADPSRYQVTDQWMAQLASISEGSQTTLGAYHKQWQ